MKSGGAKDLERHRTTKIAGAGVLDYRKPKGNITEKVVLPSFYFLRYADGEMPTFVLKMFEK